MKKKREKSIGAGWLRMTKAVEAMGVSRRTLENWMRDGKIESKLIGRCRWVRLPREMR